MYTATTMWEVEPTLYWRVKKNGKWTWVRAKYSEIECDRYPKYTDIRVYYPEGGE